MRLRFRTKREAESFAVGLTYTEMLRCEVSVNEEDGYWIVTFADESEGEGEDEGEKNDAVTWGLREDRKLPPLVPTPTPTASHCPWCGASTRTVEYVLANSAAEAEYSDPPEKYRTAVAAALDAKETSAFLAGKNPGYWVGVLSRQLCKVDKE